MLIAAKAGMCQTIEETRSLLTEHSSKIETVINQCISANHTTQSHQIHPRDIITLIDTTKGVIFRNLALRRRLQISQGHQPHVTLTFTKPHWIDEYLQSSGNTAICYYYRDVNGQIWSFIAQNFGANRPIGFVQMDVISKEDISDYTRRFNEYKSSVNNSDPDFELQDSLIKPFGERLLALFLAYNAIPKTVIFIPFGDLHILPFHTMYIEKDGEKLYLDQIVTAISYSSSLAELLYSGNMSTQIPTGTNQESKILAIVDAKATALPSIEIELMQYEVLKKLGTSLDLITSSSDMPNTFKDYYQINWSGHAKSNPVAWGESYLQLDTEIIKASTIASDWIIKGAPSVVLSGCETSIEMSSPNKLDEYCGLDVAFKIAGASSIFSSLWPIEDELGMLASMFFSLWRIGKRYTPGETLVKFQHGLRSKKWKGWQLTEGQIRNTPKHVQSDLFKIKAFFNEFDDDVFSHHSSWGAFRPLSSEL